MAITDELREYAKSSDGVMYSAYQAILVIADRIDSAHEREVADTRNDALFRANEKDMGELGWIRLPKDADGEYIHIGDRVENGERVVRIVLTGVGWEPSVYVEESYNVLREYFCNEISHYHEQTVEDVLRDYASRIMMASCIDEEDELVDEYAKRLKLAGEYE